jgi:hypothetical protein
MRGKQKQYWRNAVADMDPDNQLELAEILIEELHLNGESLDGNDNYDLGMSDKLISVLEGYVSQTSDKIEKQGILDLINRFTGLSSDNQKKIIASVIPEFLSVMQSVTKKDKILNCGKEGHKYGDNDWEKHEWTTYETVCIDHQQCPDYPIGHVKWTRECPNCGFVEEVTTEPQAVKEQREKSEKQEKIKELKKELKNLEGEQTK